MRRYVDLFVVAGVTALYSPVVGAEVMDKEFSFSTLLAWGIAGTFVAFGAARWVPLGLLIVLPIVGSFFYPHLSEVNDPHVGPAMLHEAGLAYMIFSWVCPGSIMVALLFGFVARR